MSKDFSLEVLTPSRRVLRTRTTEVYLPAHDGEAGVLPGHGDFVGLLGTGVLRAAAEGHPRFVMLSGGLFTVEHGALTILAETAEAAEEIDREKSAARVAEIEQIFADHAKYNPEDYECLTDDYNKHRARVDACDRAGRDRG